MQFKPIKKLLLIGWDGADWDIINPLIDSGQMPALERLINNGVIAKLATLDPPVSPMLWTSIATGKKADKHGILGFTEPDPDTGKIRQVNSTSRKVLAIWNILNSKGKKSNIIGWWPSQPAEPLNGVMVSNFFHIAEEPIDKEWKINKGNVSPSEIADVLAELRVHPSEITDALIAPFLAHPEHINRKENKRLKTLAKLIAEMSSIHCITTYLLENTDWDFTVVYFDAIDHFCHAFMKFHPPQMKGIPDAQFELYRDVIISAYKYQDMQLQKLIELAGDETAIMLISDHGFYSDHRRPVSLPKYPAAPVLEHNPYGIFCLSAPGIKKDERIYGASLLDITPTILTLFGLPVGRDMDGKVLINAFQNNITPVYIESWEQQTGDFGTHSCDITDNAYESIAAFRQLVELGYIEDPGEETNKAIEKSINEARYNLSRVYISSYKLQEAAEILQELYNYNNKDIRYNLNLADCFLKLGRFEEAAGVIENIKLLKHKSLPSTDLLEGILFMYQNKPRKAIVALKRAEAQNPKLDNLYTEIGKAYLQLEQYKNAEKAFNKAIELDDCNAVSYHCLALVKLRQQLYESAAENALNAIGLLYHFPAAHYHLGEALFYLKQYEEAANAFRTSLSMAVNYHKAKQWLYKIYKQHYIDNEKAELYYNQIKENMKGEIIIVSGLPRSGTSMMMKMLENSGLTLLTDNQRLPDINNPEGYFEYNPVKNLAKNKDFLEKADGKVLKVISRLLFHLPSEYNYKIIFMQRDLKEVLISQQKMLGKDPSVYPIALAKVFEKELQRVDTWVKKEPNVSILYVDYKEVINNPALIAHNISGFLERELDLDKMIKAVNNKLYRNRI